MDKMPSSVANHNKMSAKPSSTLTKTKTVDDTLNRIMSHLTDTSSPSVFRPPEPCDNKKCSTDSASAIVAPASSYSIPANHLTSRMPVCFNDSAKIPQQYAQLYNQCCASTSKAVTTDSLKLTSINNVVLDPTLHLLPDTGIVYQLLKCSGLSNEILGVIWATVNQTVPGHLTRPEFFAALALVSLAQTTGKVHPLSTFDSCKLLPPVPSFGSAKIIAAPTLNFTLETLTPPPATLNCNEVQENIDDDDFTDFQCAQTSTIIANNVENRPKDMAGIAQKVSDDNGFFNGTKLGQKTHESLQNELSDQTITCLNTRLQNLVFDSPESGHGFEECLDGDSGIASVDSDKASCSKLDLAQKFTLQSAAPVVNNNTMLYDRYAAFREIEEPTMTQYNHSGSYEHVLKACLSIFDEAKLISADLNCELIGCIGKTDQGNRYFSALYEIMAIAERMNQAANAYTFVSPKSEEVLKTLRSSWENLHSLSVVFPTLENFKYENAITDQKPSTTFMTISQKNLNMNRNEICGVCLIFVDCKVKLSIENEQRVLGDKKLCYGGRWYHAACANFWLNRISNLLPDLPVPGLLD